jgi:hypothetical protein
MYSGEQLLMARYSSNYHGSALYGSKNFIKGPHAHKDIMVSVNLSFLLNPEQ